MSSPPLDADAAWQILDPRFSDPRERSVAQAVMTMVTSQWRELPELDVADPVVMSVLRRHRIATLVPTAAVSESARSAFREQLQTTYVTQMRLQAAAIEVCTALTEAGIEHRVLKGLASAFLDYPTPELRQTGDVDLAVRPDALADTERALVGLGAARLAGSRAGELIKGTTWRMPNGLEIDVHTRLFMRTWDHTSALDLIGESVPEVRSAALPLELRLVHAAGHVLGSPVGARRLSGAADVVLLLARDPDRAKVRGLAAEHGVEALVGTSIRTILTATGQQPWTELDDWPELDWWDRRVLLSDRRRWGLEYLGRMRNVAPERRLAYLPTFLVPRRAAARKAWTDVRQRATDRWRVGR